MLCRDAARKLGVACLCEHEEKAKQDIGSGLVDIRAVFEWPYFNASVSGLKPCAPYAASPTDEAPEIAAILRNAVCIIDRLVTVWCSGSHQLFEFPMVQEPTIYERINF